MILPNLRQRLTDDDRDVVLTALARGERGRRRRLAQTAAVRGLDALLDEPELASLLENAPGYAQPSATLFLYVVVRHVLLRAGIDNPRIADYLGALVYEFALRDRAWRIATHDDAHFHYLADIITEAQSSSGERGFLLSVHLGNFSLWLAGIFPDYVTARRTRRGGPDFPYYDALGARGFRLASDAQYAEQFDLAELYAQVSDTFGTLRVALNRLSDRAFFRHVSSPDRLMRQVADGFRFPEIDGPRC